MKDPDTIY